MRLRYVLAIGYVVAAIPVYGGNPAAPATEKDRLSYSIGVEMARSLKKQSLDSNPDLVLQGFKDAQSGAPLLMTEQEISRSLTLHQNEVRRKQSLAVKNTVEENKALSAGSDVKDGTVTLPSGLRYRIIKGSDGRKPVDTNTVVYHYRGTLPDGKQFDGSENGKPVTIELRQHTSGWREALKMMPTGSVWRFYVPPKLAFEEWKVTRNKKQSQELVFEVELIAIK